jgi:hypothetical protein
MTSSESEQRTSFRPAGRWAALAVWPDLAYITNMSKSKPRVIFKMQRIKEDDWQIQAHYPDVEIRYIKGFKSKAEIDDWLAGSRRIDWLRSQGYAK